MKTDAVSYQYRTPEKFLESAKRENKKKGLNGCLNKRRKFTLFVASVDGLLGVEVEATPKHIAGRIAQNWNEPYSHTCGYVKSRVAITLVQATNRYNRGDRFMASLTSVTRPHWEYVSGLHLLQ